MEDKSIKQLTKYLPKMTRPYFYKYLLYEDVINYFKKIAHLSRVTRITRKSIYSARERGYFDDYHARRIEYCSRSNLKAIYYSNEQEVKDKLERENKSRKAKLQHSIERSVKLEKKLHTHSEDLTASELKELISNIKKI